MRTYNYISLIFVFIPVVLSAEVLIITHAYKRPDFIEIQYRTFKKFLKDDYQFVVFNDASDQNICKQINDMCIRFGLRCIRIPQAIHTYAYLHRESRDQLNSPNVRHANVIQYSLNELGFHHRDILMILDSDMFLVKEFSVREYLENHDIAGTLQMRGNNIFYIWPGLAFLNMPKLPNQNQINFNCGCVEGAGTDVGGYTHYYFKNNPGVKIRSINSIGSDHIPRDEQQMRSLGYDSYAVDFIFSATKSLYGVEFYADNCFLHFYAGGSNWPGYSESYLAEKTRLINNYINQILKA